MTMEFEPDGQPFMGLNGGPAFKFTEAISMSVACKDQTELDTYWEALSAGGAEVECGWLKDKFGLFPQIVPDVIGDLINERDLEKSDRVMMALLKMKKLDIETLRKAYEGK